MVLEGSHKLHAEFATTFSKQSKDDWYKLEPNERDWYITKKGCAPVCIKCPKGSMVFWDSRTIHCGQEPLKERGAPNFRCIVYLCYTPRDWATVDALTKKREYFRDLRMTTHWPHKIKVFSVNPRTYGKSLPSTTALPKPVLTELGKSLAGFE
jgi:hypothetical protein